MLSQRRCGDRKLFTKSVLRSVLYLESAIVSLQLSAQTLQLAACQDGLAVLVPQVIFLLDQLVLLLLQRTHLLLSVAMLFQLSQTDTSMCFHVLQRLSYAD